MANYLKNVVISGSTYEIKDAKAREALERFLGLTPNNDATFSTAVPNVKALGSAAYYSVQTTGALVSAGTALPTEGAVKAYVDAQVQTIHVFDVVISTDAATTPKDVVWHSGSTEIVGTLVAGETTMYQLYMVPDDGATATPGAYVEYITVRSGSDPNYTYTWEKIGTTVTDLTDYVQKVTKIAGISLATDIASVNLASNLANDLKGALGLGSLAYKNAVSGSASVPAQTVSVNASVTASGVINVTLKDATTSTTADTTVTGASYTPAGTVTVSVPNYVSKATLSKVATGGTQIEGTVTNNTTWNYIIADNGTHYVGGTTDTGAPASYMTDVTLTTGTYTAPTCTFPSLDSTGTSASATFAKSGVYAFASDNETLYINDAATANAYTAVKTYSMFAGTFTSGNTVLPTISAKSFNNWVSATVVTGIGDDNGAYSGYFYAPYEQPSYKFTGASYTVPLTSSTLTLTGANATFSGTASTITPSVITSYYKQVVNAKTFTGSSANVVGTVTVSAVSAPVTAQ